MQQFCIFAAFLDVLRVEVWGVSVEDTRILTVVGM